MKKIFLLIIAAIAIGVLAWLDFHVWSLKHPQAPFWTFFF